MSIFSVYRLGRGSAAERLGRALYKTNLGKRVAKAWDYVADRASLKLTKSGRALSRELDAMPGPAKEKVLGVPGLARTKYEPGAQLSTAQDKATYAGMVEADRVAASLPKGRYPRPQPNRVIPRKRAGGKEPPKDHFIEGYNMKAGMYQHGDVIKKSRDWNKRPPVDQVDRIDMQMDMLGRKYVTLATRMHRSQKSMHGYKMAEKFGENAAFGAAAATGFAGGSAYLLSKKKSK